ncbi:MAG: ATP-binding protein [Candidatus Binataceae bacterium]|jgi:signal transduction histidine kinase
MDLRVKLAIILVLIVGLPFLAVSTVQVERSMDAMVTNLGEAGTTLANQIFEQIRTALLNGTTAKPEDMRAALTQNRSLQSLLESSQAFGKAVVFARVDDLSGKPIVAAGSISAGSVQVLPFYELLEQAASWWPPTRIGALWNERTYEITQPVDLGKTHFAVIRIGLSTALIAAEAHHAVKEIVGTGAIGVLLSLLGAMIAAGIMLRPIAAITSGVEQIAAGRDEVNLPVEARDELGTLAEKFNDLSKRIKSSRVQWETERGQFINIFRSITDAVLLLDAGGAVLFANAEAQGRLGLPAGGLAEGKPLKLLIGRDNPLQRMVETAYVTGTEVRDVALDLSEGGDPNRVLVSIFALGHGPEPPGLLVVVRDLESMRELENVVDYSGRLVRLGGLIAGVAHQIRNPLNAMNLQLELLSQDSDRNLPIDHRIRALRLEIERLDRAINALMRFMRPEQLKMARCGVNELVAEAGAHLPRPGITVEHQLDPAAGSIQADRALLSEALRNVISNAAEAMPNGGAVRIRTALNHSGFVEIFVSDQGPGIPSADLARVFNLYFTTKKSGNGLGLPLALRAIDLHRGTMDIQSEAGNGTTVVIRLPVAEDRPYSSLPPVGANRPVIT